MCLRQVGEVGEGMRMPGKSPSADCKGGSLYLLLSLVPPHLLPSMFQSLLSANVRSHEATFFLGGGDYAGDLL